MKLERVKLEGVCLLVPTIYEDSRGYFFESFNQKRFNELAGLDLAFVQDNQSKSQKNVVRGLHMQAGVHAQDKLVRVIQGSIWDVVVDLRPDSKTYGEWYGVELSERNKRQLYIPKGFAHGFRTLEEGTTIVYKCSEY